MTEKNPPSSSTGVAVQMPEGIQPNLNELFSRNPLSWTEEDLTTVVAHMRQARAIFAKEDKKAKTEGRRVNAKKVLSTPSASLNLEDLGL